MIEIGFVIDQNNADWKSIFDQVSEELAIIALGTVDSIFYDLILAATPRDTYSRTGKKKGFGDHIQENWGHEIDYAGRGVTLSNPFVYGPVLDFGGYKGIGPHTVAGPGGGIYSKQAPKGIIQPFLKDPKKLDDAVRMVAKKLKERVAGLVLK